MSRRIGLYPRVRVEGGGSGVVSQAGAVVLVETVRRVGLDTAISAPPTPWRKPRTVRDPGKVLLDIALATVLRDCLADVAMLRAEPHVFGRVASGPTVSRLVDVLAAAGPKALTAIRTARAEVRDQVWELAGADGPAAEGSGSWTDGVLVLAYSEKQDATATWKKIFGHHQLVAFLDHGQTGSGGPVGTERPGAWVAEITDMPDLSTWPKGMQLIVPKERPHPGAQLRFTDLDGLRLTCLATNTHAPVLRRRPARERTHHTATKSPSAS